MFNFHYETVQMLQQFHHNFVKEKESARSSNGKLRATRMESAGSPSKERLLPSGSFPRDSWQSLCEKSPVLL